MRRLFLLLGLLLFAPLAAHAQVQTVYGWCEDGNQKVTTSGLMSTSLVQASYPQCGVQVFIHGGGLATIYSDFALTPLANPFTAATNGQWEFYVAPGRYDVVLSGGIFPNQFPTPVTLADIFVSSGGGGGGNCSLDDTIPGQIQTVDIADGGTGWTVGDTVGINYGDNQATATVATVSGGVVQSVTITFPGSHY